MINSIRAATVGFIKRCAARTTEIASRGFICFARAISRCVNWPRAITTQGLLSNNSLSIATRGLLCKITEVVKKCSFWTRQVSTHGLLTNQTLSIATRGLLCKVAEIVKKCPFWTRQVSTHGLLANQALSIATRGLLCVIGGGRIDTDLYEGGWREEEEILIIINAFLAVEG